MYFLLSDIFLLETLYRKENETIPENYREIFHKLCGKSYVNCIIVVCKEIKVFSVEFLSLQRNLFCHTYTSVLRFYSYVFVTHYVAAEKYKIQFTIWCEKFHSLPSNNKCTCFQNGRLCAINIHQIHMD